MWAGVDSNHRRLCRQIYSLLPLATRAPTRCRSFVTTAGKDYRGKLETRVGSGRGRDLSERRELAPPGRSRTVQRRQLLASATGRRSPSSVPMASARPPSCASSPATSDRRRARRPSTDRWASCASSSGWPTRRRTRRPRYATYSSVSPRHGSAALLRRSLRRAARSADDPMRYAHALGDWGDAGGYDAEVFWDACCQRALGESFDDRGRTAVAHVSAAASRSGSRWRRCCGARTTCSCSTSPTTSSTSPAKRWLEDGAPSTPKTVLFVSHDRELLAATATKIVTVEAVGAWVHGGGFAGYADARRHHIETMRSRPRALRRREEASRGARRRDAAPGQASPRSSPRGSRRRRAGCGCSWRRTSARSSYASNASTCGSRGAAHRQAGRDGRAAGAARPHRSVRRRDLVRRAGRRARRRTVPARATSYACWRVARASPTTAIPPRRRCRPRSLPPDARAPGVGGTALLDILHGRDVVRGPAMGMLRRYELTECADQTFETLRGGQQARFQILLLELSGATLLLLDEPTDNLDLVSAEALEAGLADSTAPWWRSPTTAGSCADSIGSSSSRTIAACPTSSPPCGVALTSTIRAGSA